jgi:arsenite methyltransferase
MTVTLYESEQLQRITGNTIRPGGLNLTEKAVLLCRLKKGAKVLDAGCGAGATVEYLTERHGLYALGLDLSPLLLHQGRKRNAGLLLVRGSAAHLPAPDVIFQAVFCECVLSLTAEPSAVLEEFYRVLVPGGFLILTDIYQRTPRVPQEKSAGPVISCLNRALGKDDIQSVTARKGFNIFLWEDHTPLLKTLSAQMVFAYGSMARFWSLFGQNNEPVTGPCQCGGHRPGYYLLAAKKAA